MTGRPSVAALIGAALMVAMPTLVAPPVGAAGAPITVSTATVTLTPAATTDYALGERKLRRGDRGQDVQRLQRMLRVERTAIFNKKTKKAVKRIQRAAGLKVTGRVNARTLEAIRRDYARYRTSRSLPRAGTPTQSKAHARAYIKVKYGWGDAQMACLTELWERESGWRYWVSNPNGIYRGIPQTSAAVWGSLGYTTAQYMGSPEIQIKVGTHYIKGRYGTPCRAWSFWRSHHWY